MKFSITGTPCKVSLDVPIVLRGDINYLLNKAHMYGYNGLEIHSNLASKIDSDKILRAKKKYCLDISTLGTGLVYGIDGLSFSSEDRQIRLEAVNRIKDFIILANKLNSKVIIGSVRGSLDDKYNDKCSALIWIKECLSDCIEEAEKYNVILLLEAINRYETNFLNKVEDVFEFIRDFKTNALAIHVDTFHMNIEETDICNSINWYIKNIKHIHFADSNRCYPGRGHINFRSIVDILKKNNYNEYIALECLSIPDEKTVSKEFINFTQNLNII